MPLKHHRDACVCDPGFNGSDCSDHVKRTCNNVPFDHPDVCSGKGECVAFNQCSCELGYGGETCENKLQLGTHVSFPGRHCFHIHRSNRTLPSGVYWIKPKSTSSAFEVYCDMDDKDLHGNAGWTVIQRREPSTSCFDFNQNW